MVQKTLTPSPWNCNQWKAEEPAQVSFAKTYIHVNSKGVSTKLTSSKIFALDTFFDNICEIFFFNGDSKTWYVK